MILAIDVGNTHTVFGCVDDSGRAAPVFRVSTDRQETDYGYAAKIKQILQLGGVDTEAFAGSVLSSVVPPVTDVMARAVQLLTGARPLVVGAGLKTGLHIAMDDPGTVAPDLVATAVAAKEYYPLPCVIIDMGTATTLTAVDERGRYIGGAILPGVGISMDALAQSTSLLPRIELGAPKQPIATNTVDSMKAGVLYGTAGAIDGILDRFAEQLGREPASIVTTGGLAKSVCAHCRHDVLCDEDLLLKGLWLIWQKNRK